MRYPSLVCLAIVAVALAACSQEPDYTPEQRACIASHHPTYEPRNLSQCVDACRVCMRGNVVTCNTSCIPYKYTLSLSIPAQGAPRTDTAIKPLLDQFLAQVPLPEKTDQQIQELAPTVRKNMAPETADKMNFRALFGSLARHWHRQRQLSTQS